MTQSCDRVQWMRVQPRQLQQFAKCQASSSAPPPWDAEQLKLCKLINWLTAHPDSALRNTRHDLLGDWNLAGCLDMGTSWYFSWKLNNSVFQNEIKVFLTFHSLDMRVYNYKDLLFIQKHQNNSTLMRNISWCPCLNTRLNFNLRINQAPYFVVSGWQWRLILILSGQI